MVNNSFFSFPNSISSYWTRLCAPSDSKPYGALRITIEIVLPLPPKMGWQHCVTNKEPRIQAIKPWWSNVIVKSKQLSTNDLAVFDLDAVVIICVERGSQIHGIRPLNKLTDGDVHRMLCKQKQTSALWATNGERSTRNTSNRLWTCLLQQMRLENFEIISSLSIST